MTSVDSGPIASYCVECDAVPGECGHAGGRYLEEIVYERHDKMFRVPTRERPRWDRPIYGVVKAVGLQREPKPLQQIIVEIEGWVDLDPKLEATVRACYAVNPAKVTALSDSLINAASSGRLSSPGGYLFKRLSELPLGTENGNGVGR
jgi:hypothetical protein